MVLSESEEPFASNRNRNRNPNPNPKTNPNPNPKPNPNQEPFASEPGLAASLRALPQEQIVSELLRRKDAGIHQALSGFEAQQARGAWINELCEHYYRAHPRAHDAPWPSEKAQP